MHGVKTLSEREEDCINDVVNETKGMAIKHLMNFSNPIPVYWD